MDTYTIDIEIEHYYGDRMATSSREACRRLYLRAISRFNGAELEKYLHRVQNHAAVYASLNRMLQSPFRHVETPLFLSSLVLFVASVVMASNGDTTPMIAGGMSAAAVGMINCSRRLFGYRKEYAVREAVFRELAEQLNEESTL
ncbi:GSU0071 family protein [Geomonas sp.]|uniref:GSU0071 family protein n=1 Tax=Geomonas sp. TaxID=2651584 RepID=UPI002B480168|nr:hypothetical protein [Geomonas sp.]HJV36111.1 hypothetical protein [Geomonas sp.]